MAGYRAPMFHLLLSSVLCASLHSGWFAPEERLTLETGVRALTLGALELFTGHT